MISLKRLLGLTAVSLFLASCTALPPGYGWRRPAPVNPQNVPEAPVVQESRPTTSAADRKAAAERKRVRDRKRREAARRKKAQSNSSTSSSSSSSKPTVSKPTVSKPKPRPTTSKYRTAVSIPGKSGYVFNPWTNKAVDVRGLPSGQLIRDPNDSNPSHKFRVP